MPRENSCLQFTSELDINKMANEAEESIKIMKTIVIPKVMEYITVLLDEYQFTHTSEYLEVQSQFYVDKYIGVYLEFQDPPNIRDYYSLQLRRDSQLLEKIVEKYNHWYFNSTKR